jgi:uncharacterized protein YijF (DUF1287 family)
VPDLFRPENLGVITDDIIRSAKSQEIIPFQIIHNDLGGHFPNRVEYYKLGESVQNGEYRGITPLSAGQWPHKINKHLVHGSGRRLSIVQADARVLLRFGALTQMTLAEILKNSVAHGLGHQKLVATL